MSDQITFEFTDRPTIKGFPELRWTGKRPYRSTQYFPAQLRERYGDEREGWINKIFWGDNLQVMSHLLKEFRGKVDLIYIDPPFDSKADYKKTIALRGAKATSDASVFEEKQYGDIWTNDEYLQFMYERLIIMRELLKENGSVYLHCDWHRSAFLRLLLDEVFGSGNFRNEIVWSYFGFKRATSKKFPQKHDLIYSYTKSLDYTWNVQYRPHSDDYVKRFKKDVNGRLYRDDVNPTGGGTRIIYLDEVEGDIIDSVWDDIPPVNPVARERQNYPTQKPEKLIERIIKASTDPGDLVFDCFMGSGTTQAVAMKLGRRFIGADINLGAIQTTTKRLISLAAELDAEQEIVDILRDKADLQLKRDAEADIAIEGGRLVIRAFYPLNLMQKLSLQKEFVEDWRQLVESVMIDWNYDGVVMQPAVTDVPGKKDIVKGIYDVPEDAGTIKVKITDLLSESLEVEVR